MFKTITTIILTVIAVLFSIQNFEHVPVDIFFGNPLNIRLIFVIAIAGISGYLIRHFIGISREEKLKKQIQILIRQNKNLPKRVKNDDISFNIFDYEEN